MVVAILEKGWCWFIVVINGCCNFFKTLVLVRCYINQCWFIGVVIVVALLLH